MTLKPHPYTKQSYFFPLLISLLSHLAGACFWIAHPHSTSVQIKRIKNFHINISQNPLISTAAPITPKPMPSAQMPLAKPLSPSKKVISTTEIHPPLFRSTHSVKSVSILPASTDLQANLHAENTGNTPPQGIALPEKPAPAFSTPNTHKRAWSAPAATTAVAAPQMPPPPAPMPVGLSAAMVQSAQDATIKMRQAQIVWAWSEWLNEFVNASATAYRPSSGECRINSGVWRCIFDDIPNNAIAPDSEALQTALEAFRTTLGTNAIHFSMTDEGKWEAQPSHLILPQPASLSSPTNTSPILSSSETASSTPATINKNLN